MFPSPSVSLWAMLACVLGDRGTPRYCCTPVILTACLGSQNTVSWEDGFTIHLFLFPTMSIRRDADLPSSPTLISRPWSLDLTTRWSSKDWQLCEDLVISAMLSAKALDFILISPTSTPSSGSNEARAPLMIALKKWTKIGSPCCTARDISFDSLWLGPIRMVVLASWCSSRR